MKLIESWRFAIKCIKLSHNLKPNILCSVFLCILALVLEFTKFGNIGLGAFLLMTVAIYPSQMLYSVCGSQLVQSSPYKKVIMTSLTMIVTLSCGILYYLIIAVVEGIRVMINPVTAWDGAGRILFVGILHMLLEVYVATVYRYYFISVVVMIGGVMSFCYLIGFVGDGSMVLQYFSGLSMPAAIAGGLCLAVLGSLLQYGISLLVYKRPISRSAIFGMLRHQA